MEPVAKQAKEIEDRLGRPLRILQIGNIANNGFMNSKLLTAAGVDVDLISVDYYQSVGTPEWEDADFDALNLSDMPDWDQIDIKGYERPRWVAQGPMQQCIDYLLARRNDAAGSKTNASWNALNAARAVAIRSAHGKPKGGPRLFFEYVFTRDSFQIQSRVARKFNQIYEDFLRWNVTYGAPGAILQNLIQAIYFLIVAFGYVAILLPWIVLRSTLPRHFASRADRRWMRQREQFLVNQFRVCFPDRRDQLSDSDSRTWSREELSASIRKLFSHYDIIHAYAYDGIWPLLYTDRPYVAFEHGTIRQLPFEDSPVGRMTALVYRSAAAVLISNADNNVSAAKLGIEDYRFVPHPVSEDWIAEVGEDDRFKEWRRKIELLKPSHESLVIFHPPRQHWQEVADGDPSWQKANHLLYRAFARHAKNSAAPPLLICIEHGQKIQESKLLLRELGVDHLVMWIRPLGSRDMTRVMLASDLIADQFFVGSFGGIPARAMLAAKPVMTIYRHEMHEWCLPEAPPFLMAKTEEEIFEILNLVDRNSLKLSGELGRRWYQKYHSNNRIGSDLISTYRSILEKKNEL